MPYKRKGKCIYNKETGEKKGCSTSVGKAKKYMRALYAAENGIIKEEESELSQAIKDRAEDIYQAMKATALDSAVDRYKADAEDVLRRRAIKIAKNQVKMKTNDQMRFQFFDMYVSKIREIGLEIPDADLKKNEDGTWNYSDPDWEEFKRVISGDGPCNSERLAVRKASEENGRWVREALKRPVQEKWVLPLA
jgi:cation transport regulator ChaB